MSSGSSRDHEAANAVNRRWFIEASQLVDTCRTGVTTTSAELLLLTIAVPRYFSHLEKAKEATLKQDLTVMRDAIDMRSLHVWVATSAKLVVAQVVDQNHQEVRSSHELIPRYVDGNTMDQPQPRTPS